MIFSIVSTGSEYNYFGHYEWRERAPSLKTLDDASLIRQGILDAFERAEKELEGDQVARELTFVLVGGGPTGVEMAGAIAELSRSSLKRDFRRIDPTKSRIVLIEALPRLLSGFDKSLADAAERKLKQLGVEVRLGKNVRAVSRDSVTVGDEEIPAATVVWTAGVKGSSAAKWLGAETDRSGRIIVQPDLTIPGHPEVFVIGDTPA